MNYTSQITQYKEPRSQLDGELMSQVLAAKDKRYDLAEARLDSKLAQYANFQIDNPEVKAQFGEELDKLIHSVNNSNLRDIGDKNIEKRINNHLGKILTPEYLQHNQIHLANKKYESEVEKMRADDPDSFTEKNYQDAKIMSGYYNYMSTGNISDVNTKQLRYKPYVDNVKESMDLIESVKDARGEYVTYREDANGNIIEIKDKNLTADQIKIMLPNLMSEQMKEQARIEGSVALGYNQESASAMHQDLVNNKIQSYTNVIEKKKTELEKLSKFGNNEKKEKALGAEIKAFQEEVTRLRNKPGSTDLMTMSRELGIANLSNRIAQSLGQRGPNTRPLRYADQRRVPSDNDKKTEEREKMDEIYKSTASSVTPIDPDSLNDQQNQDAAESIRKREKESKEGYLSALDQNYEAFESQLGTDMIDSLREDYAELEGAIQTPEGFKEYVINTAHKNITVENEDGSYTSGLKIKDDLQKQKRDYENLSSIINDAYETVDILRNEEISTELKKQGDRWDLTKNFVGTIGNMYKLGTNGQVEEIGPQYFNNKTEDEIFEELNGRSQLKASLLAKKVVDEYKRKGIGEGDTYLAEDFRNILTNFERYSFNSGNDVPFTSIFKIEEVVPSNSAFKRPSYKELSSDEELSELIEEGKKGAIRVSKNITGNSPYEEQFRRTFEEYEKDGGTKRFDSSISKALEGDSYRGEMNQLLVKDKRYKGNRQYTFEGLKKDTDTYASFHKLSEDLTSGEGIMFQPERPFKVRLLPGESHTDNPTLEIMQQQTVTEKQSDDTNLKVIRPTSHTIQLNTAMDLLNTEDIADRRLSTFLTSIAEDTTGPGHKYLGDISETNDNVSYFKAGDKDQSFNIETYVENNPRISPEMGRNVIDSEVKNIMQEEMRDSGILEDPDNAHIEQGVKDLISDTSNISIDLDVKGYGGPKSRSFISVNNKESGEKIVSLPISKIEQAVGSRIDSETIYELYNTMPIWFYNYAIKDAIREYKVRGNADDINQIIENARTNQ